MSNVQRETIPLAINQMLSLIENDSLAAILQNSSLSLPLYSPCQDSLLDLGAHFDKLCRAVGMVDPLHILLDDGSFVEGRCHEVGCGSDQLDSTSMGLMVGLCALEGREEGVVNIDDFAAHYLAKLWAQNLHVSGQDDEVDLVFFHQLQYLLLLPFFRVFGVDGEVMEWNIVLSS